MPECINCSSMSDNGTEICDSCTFQMNEMMEKEDEITNSNVVDLNSNMLTQYTTVTGKINEYDPENIRSIVRDGKKDTSGYWLFVLGIIVVLIIALIT